MKELLLIFGLTLVFIACATTTPLPPQTPTEMKATGGGDYPALIDSHTQFYRKYDGLYEIFRGHATMHTPEASSAILNQRSKYLEWDDRKFNEERIKSEQQPASE